MFDDSRFYEAPEVDHLDQRDPEDWTDWVLGGITTSLMLGG